MNTPPPLPTSTEDESHLRTLGLLHYVLGGIIACFALLPMVHVGMGLVLALAPEKMSSGSEGAPPAFLGWIFVVIGTVLVFMGWSLAAATIYLGRCLRRKKNHTGCLVVACVECMFMPLGTLLGVLTIIALVRPTVKRLFGTDGARPHA
ncbi:membrane protein [Opitutales bacterium ASA1]|uniref:hypothetical protein n=1 Tax=Congregicoccus parvus TaxID=3081749 RepID=UPI002B28E1E2|nr:membrane protein [Opitutales bacterium ASA1]